jgi:6-phosphogluconolactonase
MPREQLFDQIKIPTENLHRILGANNPDQEAERYSDLIISKLPRKNNLPSFDLIILGMGDDGHTASIFPNQMNLIGEESICAVARHPGSGQLRISLTGTAINNAQIIAFLVTGAGKKEKVTEVLNHSGDWEKYPASYINPADGTLHWFLDQDAAP